LLAVPRSTASYRSRRRAPSEIGPLKVLIETLLVTLRGYGVRRMHAQLRRMKVSATRSEVRRVYLELGRLKAPPAKKKVRTTNSRHDERVYPDLVKGLKLERPDQVWAADATYFKVKRRFAHLALVMDAFTREILGWSLSFANDTALTLEALKMARKDGRSPRIHHSDRGSNYAAKRYVSELGPLTRVSMTDKGCPQDNGRLERLNRTVKEEEIYWSEYQDLEEARQGLESFVAFYNERRIHSALQYKTPKEAFREWKGPQTETPLT
jgi:putative transposase